MAHQFKYASPEAKSEDLRRYDKQQEEFKKQKKMWGKFLLDFFLYQGEEKNIRFLVPFNEIIQIYEYLVETKKGFWKSFTSRQAEGLEGDAFAEVGLKPRRAFIIPIYDYAHIDKPYEGEDKRTPEE